MTLHHTINIKRGGNLHCGRLGLLLKKVTVGGLACQEGPVTHAVGQSPAAIHSRAVPNRGHMHILRLQAQIQLGHVITKPSEAGVFRKIECPFFVVKVARTHLGQVLTAGVQIVVILQQKQKENIHLFSNLRVLTI